MGVITSHLLLFTLEFQRFISVVNGLVEETLSSDMGCLELLQKSTLVLKSSGFSFELIPLLSNV